MEDLEKTLAHYGVRGMRWGHRKRSRESSSAPVGPEGVIIRKNKAGKLEAVGGRGHSPAEDALKATAIRQKAKASGTHSLSNAELKVLVDRMNLEGQYAKLLAANAPQATGGKAFIKKLLKDEGNALVGGKNTKAQNILEFIIKAHQAKDERAAAKAAAKAASSTARRAAKKTAVYITGRAAQSAAKQIAR